MAWRYRVIPKSREGEVLVVYSDAADPAALSRQLEVLFGRKFKVEQAETSFVEELLTKNYLKSASGVLREFNVDSDNFIHEAIKQANQLGGSDIHLEPYQDRCRIRMRLDGKLIESYELKRGKYNEYINKLKILSNLDIAEKRLPQDGRILVREAQYQYDIRVSILPTLYGEKAVLRLLSSDASNLNIEDLGFTPRQYEAFKKGISKTQGIVLISGPTGSGKTTTLYGALKTLNKTNTNILTVEDPVEYTLEGINQVQVNEKIGLGFAETLRSFLRQDPDIIMVGEIRDKETAQIAVRAAMTGHLVMSTVHTNSAYGIIARLIEMGISNFLLADTLNIAVAQRLIRKLCPDCKQQETNMEHLPPLLQQMGIQSYAVPKGCANCHGTGYKGRKAIYEVIPVNDSCKRVILENGPQENLDKFDTLMDIAIESFKKGETSLDEIYPYLI